MGLTESHLHCQFKGPRRQVGFETERKRRPDAHPHCELKGPRRQAGFETERSEGPKRPSPQSLFGPKARERLAERVGFEPTVAFRLQRLSRPADSTTLAPLRDSSWLGPRIIPRRGSPATAPDQVESTLPRDRSCVNPGLRATMRAFNPARPGREQRLGEALSDAVGSGFTHGRSVSQRPPVENQDPDELRRFRP